LLLNPKLKAKDQACFEFIIKKWSLIYRDYQDTFIAYQYKANEETEASITQNGFLNINWQNDMDDFDLLIATPVIPIPKRLVSGKEIADRMLEMKNTNYFDFNIKANIKTFQDEQIQLLIKK